MRYSVFPCSYRYIYHHKNTERENKMNNKRIIKTISAIALLLSLSLTACGTQDTQLLTATEESMQETATQETEANTETTTDTESPLAQRDALEWEQRLD